MLNKENFLIRNLILFTMLISCLLIVFKCDKKHKALVAPDETIFPDAPQNIIVKIGDGQVTLTWKMKNENNVHSYHIFRKNVEQSEMDLLDSCLTKHYTDKNVTNGIIYYYQIAAVDSMGFEGKPSKEVMARPSIFSVIIEDGAEYINKKQVTLKLSASTSSRYVKISNDSLFLNSTWEPFSLTNPIRNNWSLSAGDGTKYVYVKFKEEDGTETQFPVFDTIALDTKATITEVTENTNGQQKVPGQEIRFKLVTGEPDGKATIDIGNVKQGIKLYDDGSNGDLQPDDGTYELKYKIPLDLEVVEATITGHFIDRVNNIANDVTASTKVSIKKAAAFLFPPAQSGTSQKALILYWQKNTNNNFESYRLFRSNSPGVSSKSSNLIATIPNKDIITHTDTDVKERTDYYYRLFVYYDKSVYPDSSYEEHGRIDAASELPTPVILLDPIPVENSLTSLNISWSQNEDENFSYYRIYRGEVPGVNDSTYSFVKIISDRNTTSYEDTNLKEDTEYYYRVDVYNTAGQSAPSEEKMGKTNANEPPRPVNLHEPLPLDNSLTSLRLSWSRNEDKDFYSYRIYRDEKPGVSDSTSLLVKIITDQNTIKYEDTGLKEDTKYYYKVYVYDTGGLSAESEEQMGKTNANMPPTPVNLYVPTPVDGSTTSLNLDWSTNEDQDFKSYKIYRSDSPGVDLTKYLVQIIQNQSTSNYEDKNLKADTEYYYRVYVFDTGGLYSESKEQKGKTSASEPNEPPTPVILAWPSVVDSVTLHLSWTRNNDDDFSYYSISRSTIPLDTTYHPIEFINNQAITVYDDKNLETNTTYFYRVFVTDKEGLRTASNEVSGTPKP